HPETDVVGRAALVDAGHEVSEPIGHEDADEEDDERTDEYREVVRHAIEHPREDTELERIHRLHQREVVDEVFDDRPDGAADPTDRIGDPREGRPLEIAIETESGEDIADDATERPPDEHPDDEDDGGCNDVERDRGNVREHSPRNREVEALECEEDREDVDDVFDELAERTCE